MVFDLLVYLVVVKKLTTSWSKIVGCQIENNKLTLAVLPEGKLKLKNAGRDQKIKHCW